MILSEDSRVAAAQAYIDALFSHDGDAVSFAAGCTRAEQAMKNGFSGNHLRRKLNRGPQYRFPAEATPAEFRIAGDHVYAADESPRGSFGIPAQSPSGKAEMQHIKVRFQPFIQR